MSKPNIARYFTDDLALFIEPDERGVVHNAIFECEKLEHLLDGAFPAEMVSDETFIDTIDDRTLALIAGGFVHAAFFRFNAAALPVLAQAARQAPPHKVHLAEAEHTLARHYANSPLLTLHIEDDKIAAEMERFARVQASAPATSKAERARQAELMRQFGGVGA